MTVTMYAGGMETAMVEQQTLALVSECSGMMMKQQWKGLDVSQLELHHYIRYPAHQQRRLMWSRNHQKKSSITLIHHLPYLLLARIAAAFIDIPC